MDIPRAVRRDRGASPPSCGPPDEAARYLDQFKRAIGPGRGHRRAGDPACDGPGPARRGLDRGRTGRARVGGRRLGVEGTALGGSLGQARPGGRPPALESATRAPWRSSARSRPPRRSSAASRCSHAPRSCPGWRGVAVRSRNRGIRSRPANSRSLGRSSRAGPTPSSQTSSGYRPRPQTPTSNTSWPSSVSRAARRSPRGRAGSCRARRPAACGRPRQVPLTRTGLPGSRCPSMVGLPRHRYHRPRHITIDQPSSRLSRRPIAGHSGTASPPLRQFAPGG